MNRRNPFLGHSFAAVLGVALMSGKAMYLERVGDTLVGCGIYKG